MSRGIALLFHDRCTRRWWVVSSTPRPQFTPGKDPVPILQEAGWAPGSVWTGGKSRPHRDQIYTCIIKSLHILVPIWHLKGIESTKMCKYQHSNLGITLIQMLKCWNYKITKLLTTEMTYVEDVSKNPRFYMIICHARTGSGRKTWRFLSYKNWKV